MHFFLTLKRQGDLGFLPFEEIDELPDDVCCILNIALPLGAIQTIRQAIQKRRAVKFWPKGFQAENSAVKTKVLKVIHHLGWELPQIAWKEVSSNPQPKVTKRINSSIVEDFNKLVIGRQLSKEDFQVLARQLGVGIQELIALAHLNVEKGDSQWVPSVKRYGQGWQCQRCGEKDVEEWPGPYGVAATCRSCESIGPSTSLGALYRDQRKAVNEDLDVVFQPHWVLTEAQQLAGEQVLNFIMDPGQETALLWAACGAGKTEVCFPSAAWALSQGKTVLFAAPRQDVIHDVVPRIQRDFPGYSFQVLSGRTLNKFQCGGMVLATTHQVLRFWQAFDVIFMDEMDAFPYRGNHALEWGIKHALRQGGKILYLTATPSQEGLDAVQRGKMQLIRLPARHHRCPLPVPVWKKSRHTISPDRYEEDWILQIKSLRKEGPVLIFVPKVSWIAPWIESFRRLFPEWAIDGSYSADSDRVVKIEKLTKGEYDIFVSTTILERGITLSGIQVIVLAADHPMFDERALVQMAGRVGRTQARPKGKVVFISEGKTRAMVTAIEWIIEQNRLALELGLID